MEIRVHKKNPGLEFGLWVLSRIAKMVYLSYHKTIKIQATNLAAEPCNITHGNNYIYAFWHGKTFLILPRYKNFKIGVLTLLDFKNLFYDRLCQSLGYQTVPVVSNERAAVSLKKLLEEGYHIALAVDGPKGPRGIIRPGATYLAAKMSKSVIAVKIKCEKSFRIKSRWDHYEIPYPFTKAWVISSQPISITNETEEEINQKIKEHLGNPDE